MRRVAFLTEGWLHSDDALAVAALHELGIVVDDVSWRSEHDWGGYDLLVIRSTWDYYLMPERFVTFIDRMRREEIPLQNPAGLVLWNLDKTYLRDLTAKGLPVLPTTFLERLRPGDLDLAFAADPGRELVLKPTVGANSHLTYRMPPDLAGPTRRKLEAEYVATPAMIQPLAEAVLTEGEFSLIYIDGTFSHAVRKVPREGDFRVQDTHGGETVPAKAGPALRALGEEVMAILPDAPLYARADFVHANDSDDWWLMELELVEPSLYLEQGPGAAGRFARAIAARID